MRSSTTSLLIFLAFGACTSTGCAKPKQADDPTNESTHPPATDDGTASTKWEGATPAPPAATSSTQGAGNNANVQEAATRRTDQYDKEGTEVVLKRAARQVKENCGAARDEAGNASGPFGKATLQIILGRNGHSKGLTMPPPFQGKPTGNCVEKAFTNLTFPPWGGPDTEVSWDIEIVPITTK
jgi:hypothetical protein